MHTNMYMYMYNSGPWEWLSYASYQWDWWRSPCPAGVDGSAWWLYRGQPHSLLSSHRDKPAHWSSCPDCHSLWHRYMYMYMYSRICHVHDMQNIHECWTRKCSGHTVGWNPVRGSSVVFSLSALDACLCLALHTHAPELIMYMYMHMYTWQDMYMYMYTFLQLLHMYRLFTHHMHMHACTTHTYMCMYMYTSPCYRYMYIHNIRVHIPTYRTYSTCTCMCTLQTLCHRVGLHISIIVLTGPHKATLTLESLSHHIINQPMLIPDSFCLKLGFVLTAIHMHTG